MNRSPDLAGADVRRTRRANLARLLQAKSIAFIGGAGLARAVVYCRELGFAGDVWTVHPTYDEIGGIACVPSPRDLPCVPDAAFLAVSSQRTIPIVAELAAMGAGSAVCYTSGFAEVDDGRLAGRAGGGRWRPHGAGWTELYRRHQLLRCRPRLPSATTVRTGPSMASPLSHRAVPSRSTLSAVIVPCRWATCSASATRPFLTWADYIDVVADDDRVSAIVLYVEGLKDVRAFAAACAKAFAKGIPIVALKAGLSETGRQIALSHTGSMTGVPELYQALFDRLGIVSVTSFSELLEAVKILALSEPPAGSRLSIETCSGTDSGYCADLADRFGVDLPQPDDQVKANLREVIPAIATPMNPLDVTMAQWADREAQATSLITLLQQPTDAAALIINLPHGAGTATYLPAIDAMVDVRSTTGLPCYVISNLAEGLPKDVRDRMIAQGIVPLQGIEDAFAALGRVARNVMEWRRMRDAGGPNAHLLAHAGAGGPAVPLDEWASKAWLKATGIALPEGRYVKGPEDAVAAAEAIGFPVVVKAAGPKLQHKSEVGAVALGLADRDAVRQVTHAMTEDIVGAEGLIVETMISDAVAEVIVGAKRDDLFGMSLMIGAGGIFTELMRDTKHLLLPVSHDDVRRAVEGLKIAPLLHGLRGKPPGDVEALIDAILAIADELEHGDTCVVELDVNPLLVRAAGHGVVAVDALLTVEGETA